MFKRSILIPCLILLPLLLAPAAVSAIEIFPNKQSDNTPKYEDGVCRSGNGVRQSAVCVDEKVDSNPFTGPGGVLTNLINLLSIIVAIVAVIMIILGGLKFITSGNNPQDVQTARERIIYALVALAVAGLAQAMVQFVLSKL